jgi:hypothetical protein
MSPSNDQFRERLLTMERVTPSLKEHYEQEIQAMLEKKLSRAGRIVWLLATIASLGFAIVFLALAVLLPTSYPWQVRLGFVGGALFGLGWALLGVRILRRGSLNLRIDEGFAAGMAWVWPVFLVTIFLVWAPDNMVGMRMIVSGLAFLLMGAVFLLASIIRQSELSGREKLLEIEYKLAELTETIRRDGLSAAQPGS